MQPGLCFSAVVCVKAILRVHLGHLNEYGDGWMVAASFIG